jgi:hypothetical protein
VGRPEALATGSPRRPSRAVAGVVVITLVGLVIGLRAWEPERAPSVAPGSVSDVAAPPAGRLAYVAAHDDGQRLWVVDLASGAVRPGPEVEDVLDLVDLSEAHARWLGVETSTAGGSVRAIAFRGLDREVEATTLARGERIAWGPGGASLVVAADVPTAGRCRHIRIDLVTVRTGGIQRGRDADVCGPLLSLGRSAAATYFTAETEDGIGTFFSGTIGVRSGSWPGPLTERSPRSLERSRARSDCMSCGPGRGRAPGSRPS